MLPNELNLFLVGLSVAGGIRLPNYLSSNREVPPLLIASEVRCDEFARSTQSGKCTIAAESTAEPLKPQSFQPDGGAKR